MSQQWTAEDGLPVNSIVDVAITSDGFLWLATGDGLVRFDGTTFRTYTAGNTPTLTSSRISLLQSDRSGNLWIITEQRDLFRYADGMFEAYNTTTGFPGKITGPYVQAVDPIYEAPDSSIWFATVAGVARYHQGVMTSVAADHITGSVQGFAGDPRTALWVLSNTAAFRIGPDQQVRTFSRLDGLPTLPLHDVLVDAQDQTWITSRAGSFRLAGERFEPIYIAKTRAQDLFSPASGHVVQAPDSTIYLYTVAAPNYRLNGTVADTLWFESLPAGQFFIAPLDGIFEWSYDTNTQDGRLHILNDGRLVHTLPSGVSITALALDEASHAWIGTSHGLLHLRPSIVTVWTHPSPSQAGTRTNVYAIAQAQDGAVWLGTLADELLRISGTDLSVYTHTSLNLAYGHPWSLHEDRSGKLWVGGYGVCGINPRSPCGIVDGESIYNVGEVRAIYEDRDQRFWIGGEYGHAYFYNGAWHAPDSTVLDAPPETWTRAFLQTDDGAVWVGTNGGGVFRYQSGRYDVLDQARGGCSNLVRDLYQDAKGSLWLATEDQGLCRIRNPEAPIADLEVTSIKQSEGLYQDAVHSILEDDADRLWMNSNQGIFWVHRSDLNAVADGTSERVVSTWYDERDGLLNREGNGGVQPSALRDRQGRLWFATQNGAVMVEPTEAEPDYAFRAIHIDAVRSEGQALSPRTPHLRASQREVVIDYVMPSLASTKAARYQYRLLGHDETWYDAGTSGEARFANLNGAAYTFEVRATDLRGTRVSSVTSLPITRTPYVYETGWFIVLAIAGGLGLIFGGVQWRLHQISHRNHLLQQRVDERTAELATALDTMAEQAEALQSLDAAKSRFFANVSHELRTPLTLIIGPLRSLLDGDYGRVSDAVSHQHRMMLRNGRRLLRLINQILDLAQLESGALPLYATEQDLAAFVARNVDAFQPLAQRHDLDLRFSAPNTACPVYFDPQQMEIIVVNLLSNALKFTPAGGSVQVTVQRTAESAIVRVQDTGYGIAKENLERVFDRFFQQEGSPGTGIGLALVRELVHLHHGRITVESEAGRGSTFTVYLPLGVDHLAPNQRVDPRLKHSTEPHLDASEPAPFAPAQQTHNADTPLVLIVDDNPDIRDYLSTLLHTRYRLAEASDGQEAVEHVRQHLPDLIVSDVMMPQRDGFALSRALKTDPMTAHIPLILLTAKASSTSTLEGLSAGADDYLTKPFDPDELRARIHNQLIARQRLRDRYSTPSTRAPLSGQDTLSDQARAVVLSRLADPTFTVQQLAEALNMTYATFNRRLRKDANVTPNVFIRHVRLNEAARLLKNDAGSVSEVAYAVGFNSLSYFTKSFSEHFDCLPSAYIAAAHVRP
ncbi:MAG: hybrid sensor histidine kinase/response regulator transcription factor [Rhodothermales bacterium]